MRIDIITLFPEFFASPLQTGLLGKALQQQIATVYLTNPRDLTQDKHRRVDDECYGGGVGMLLKPEPLFAAVRSLPQLAPREVILMTPQGEPLNQAMLRELTGLAQLVILCGHYEGVDERVRSHLATREVSLGDFVLTCGEIPALALINGVVRLLPGTVGKQESLKAESFEAGLLDYPQYTRPPNFEGLTVPAVLLSGNHQAVARWRRQQQILRTWQRRPDLLSLITLAPDEQADLNEWIGRQEVSRNEDHLNSHASVGSDHDRNGSPSVSTDNSNLASGIGSGRCE